MSRTSTSILNSMGREERESQDPVPLLATTGVRYVFVPVALVVLVLLGGSDRMSEPRRLIFLSVLLLVYLGSEILCERHRRPRVWFLSYPTLTSVVSFALPFALTNVVFWTPFRDYYFRRGVSFELLNKVVALALVAALCLWIGYRASLGKKMAQSLRRLLSRWEVIKVSFRPMYIVVVTIVVITTVIRYVMVQNGMYGMMKLRKPPAQLAMYLNWMRGLGQVCLLVITIDYFSEQGPKSGKGTILVLVLMNELLWAFLTGFKARAVFPIAVLGVGYAVVRGRIPKGAIVAFIAALFVTYSILEPFRQAIGDNAFNRRSVGSAVTMLSKIALGKSRYGASEQSRSTRVTTWMRIIDRTNQTGMGAIAVWFEDEKNARPEVEAAGPRIETILTSPLRAVIPRFLWPDKPTVRTLGEWFRIHGVGGPVDSKTAIGMSIVGYLYIAGGIGAIVVCFLVLGLMQRVVLDAFLPLGGGGFLVYAGLMSIFIKLPSSFDPIIINLIRLVPILIFVQYFMFKSN